MWTRTYLLLLALRLYFALSPSYIHPDENFQGPEVIAGKVFNLPNHLSWEFTSEKPVRSVYPLWPVYGMPMVVLQWIWAEIGDKDIPSYVLYYVLRGLMFTLSFVLEDWALHELSKSPRHYRLTVVLVASSYVTWTYQTHTFSNSVETIVVLWTLVMFQRLRESRSKKDPLLSPAILGSLLTFGIFNRITFPAFVLLPGLATIPSLARRPLSILILGTTVLFTCFLAIAQDTYFFRSDTTFRGIFTNPIVTPLNSFQYNSKSANLELHGLHPRYQHLLANLPLLLGPGLFLLRSIDISTVLIQAAISGTLILSVIPHQEARFLLPAVPLILSSVRLPRSRGMRNLWLGSWVLFNAVFGLLMGTYHQGGVVPMQIWLSQHYSTFVVAAGSSITAQSLPLTANTTQVFWWRTYPPPIWLLGHAPLSTETLMGIPLTALQQRISTALSTSDGRCDPSLETALVAPLSRLDLAAWQRQSQWQIPNPNNVQDPLIWHFLWEYTRHLNLDDLDFGDSKRGVLGELQRVIGKRGLGLWSVRRNCDAAASSSLPDDTGNRKHEGGLTGDW